MATGSGVLRRMTWKTMDERDRAALCHRGLDEIFDPALRASIGRIIDDVREHGDEAVCRALRDFDHIDLRPDQLRVTADEIAAATVSAAVDAALDDAIAHLRAFNEQLMERASNWFFESEPGR
jgi:histidinol dehydrogenase